MSSLLLDALACKNRARPPVWMMRQAGRVLPSYRALRDTNSLEELFHHPELIAEITLMPVDQLGVDAAILFSDIMTVVEGLGLSYSFPKKQGPVVSPSIESPYDLKRIKIREDVKYSYVTRAIQAIKERATVPLIGFCGGPLTVATYMLKGGKGQLEEWIKEEPASLHRLLQFITEASKHYLSLQIEAGVDAIQLFDSWSGLLPRKHFLDFALPAMRELTSFVTDRKIPCIVFTRGASCLTEALISIRPTAISFDWDKEINQLRRDVPPHIAVQGNLNPEVLLEPPKTIERETEKMLEKMENEPGYIVNLGHGLLPNTPLEHIKTFVQTVKQ